MTSQFGCSGGSHSEGTEMLPTLRRVALVSAHRWSGFPSLRLLSSSAAPPASLNPLGVPITMDSSAVSTRKRTAIAHFRNLPVSPKKLRVVANLAPRLHWREAMAQLEHCRKNMAVMVKNCIDSAVGNAEHEGLDKSKLMVKEAQVNKGSYYKKPHFKAKMTSGTKFVYFSHLKVVLQEMDSVEDVKKHARLTSGVTASENWIMKLPWEERLQHLPRYVKPKGYDPVRR